GSTSAAFETSVLTKRASPPASLIIRTVSSPPSTRTSATTVFAPSRANASALALPIPEAAPVTKATLPSNCLVMSPLPDSAPLIGPPDVRLGLRFVMDRYNDYTISGKRRELRFEYCQRRNAPIVRCIVVLDRRL